MGAPRGCRTGQRLALGTQYFVLAWGSASALAVHRPGRLAVEHTHGADRRRLVAHGPIRDLAQQPRLLAEG